MKLDFSELIKRNSPVLFIGGITALLFIVIIVASQRSPITKPTTLIEISDNQLITTHTYIKGNIEAPISIVEFSDFGCPACKEFHPIMNEIFNDYPDKIKWSFRHFPLPQHKNAFNASIAAQAAGEQNKFWEYADILFEKQDKFDEKNLVEYADFLGLDTQKFKDDIKNASFKELVQEDVDYGKSIGINSTPTYFLNGKQLMLNDYGELRIQIEAEIAKYSGEAIKIQEEKQKDIQEQKISQDIYKVIDDRFGVYEVSFTEDGFKPRNGMAYAGQLVKWTNNTSTDMKFIQVMDKFKELEEPFVIPAGETFEFRILLRSEGIWTYKNEGSTTRASLSIQRLPDELQQLLPDQKD